MNERKWRKVISADLPQDKRRPECAQHCPVLECCRRSTSASCPLAPIFGGDPTAHEHDHLFIQFAEKSWHE